jgi:putative oxidoreductase
MALSHSMSAPRRGGLVQSARILIRFADSIPLSLSQFAGRIAVAQVFWQSAQTKLASWPVTLQLFAFEYKLPILPPEVAAPLATAAEMSGAIMLALGLVSRLAALMLLGVVATIQVFVYPGHWAEHLLWTSVLLLIFSRGAGILSLDAILGRFLAGRV